MGNVLRGDLGPSFFFRDFTVGELFRQGLPISIEIGGYALLLALFVGGLLGILAAMKQNKGPDYAVMTLATMGITIPNFVVAPVLTLIFGVMLGWLPVGGWNNGAWENKILPILTLGLPQVAIVARLTRGSMIEALRSHHIRTARANGLPQWMVVVVHALRGALLPVVSYAGPAAAALADRFGGDRNHLWHSRRWPLFRSGCSQSRLYPGYGHRDCDRCLHHDFQPDR